MGTSLIATVVGLIVVIAGFVAFVVVSRSLSPSRSAFDQSSSDDDRYWVLDVLYNNPNDPRVLVPKRHQGGLTLNIGHPLGQLVMIGTVALVVVLGVLAKLSPGH